MVHALLRRWSQFTRQAFLAAEIAAKAVLDEALGTFRPDAWDIAYGSSGTAGAVGDVLAAGGPQGLITAQGLDWLQDRLLRSHHADRVRSGRGLKEDRRADWRGHQRAAGGV